MNIAAQFVRATLSTEGKNPDHLRKSKSVAAAATATSAAAAEPHETRRAAGAAATRDSLCVTFSENFPGPAVP